MDDYDDEYYDDYVEEEEGPDPDPEPRARGSRAKSGGRTAARGGKAKRSGNRGRRASSEPKTPPGGMRRAPRAKAGSGAIGQVSRFSATALSKVTVLGDRPGQMVYSLAEQSRRKRGTAVLAILLALAVVAMLSLLGVFTYRLINPVQSTSEGAPAPIVEPPEGHSTLTPDLFYAQSEQELFAPIAERADNEEPLTEEEVFGSSTQTLSLDDFELTLRDSEVTDTCTALVWGDQFAQDLSTGSCSAAARGVYQDPGEEYVAQFTLFDLVDSDAADTALANLDSGAEPGFVLPMNTEIDGLQSGYSQATAQVMGHYLAVFWVARADGGKPGDDDSMATLNVVVMDSAVVVYERVHEAAAQEGGEG
ncbi:hypothetical protein Nans01_02700 [Nocardiopsis ansamitocini]|uniref:Uncharacterized protein n=1 Tax=Nocardiopsis ansamitocini TaxID=1670832 RepID=A0A9W6UGW4_9ACTN|nr:hypothetical protein Nans01_02700 [Nocardiopsis ansamitocini]